MNAVVAAKRAPRWYVYVLGAVIAVIVAIPVWIVFVMLVIQPSSLMNLEQTMGNRIFWLIIIPVVLVALLFTSMWRTAVRRAQVPSPVIGAVQEESDAAHLEQAKREYVLEIMGMGVTLDKYRQGKLWEALQKGSPYSSVREQDPKKYPWDANEKAGLGGKRMDDALENGFSHSPMYWGVPSFFAGGPDPEGFVEPVPVLGEIGGANLDFHLTVAAPWMLAERPDRLLEKVFSFFDTHADVPYIVLTAIDGMGVRDLYRMAGNPSDYRPLLTDGYYVPEMPDASAVFILARRERVDPLRKFVWDDPDDEFLHDKLRWMYCTLESDLPQPDRKSPSRTVAQIAADSSMTLSEGRGMRPITVDEWLEASAIFSKRYDVVNQGTFFNVLHHRDFPVHRPPQGWKPTPWFPVPWTRDQLKKFDNLPSLGFLHRPTFVKMSDEHGKPLERREARQQALLAGWREALLTLPEADRLKTPARLIVATGGNAEQTIALNRVLREHEALGGPELDTSKPTQFIDTDRRLGNTGAATLFVQMAIGVMGSHLDGGISAAINLRDRGEASIVFISPPLPEHVKPTTNGAPFESHVTPNIDPKNYVTPPLSIDHR